jgi:hypothetical protein
MIGTGTADTDTFSVAEWTVDRLVFCQGVFTLVTLVSVIVYLNRRAPGPAGRVVAGIGCGGLIVCTVLIGAIELEHRLAWPCSRADGHPGCDSLVPSWPLVLGYTAIGMLGLAILWLGRHRARRTELSET